MRLFDYVHAEQRHLFAQAGFDDKLHFLTL